jgi:ATP-dependent helicase/DNAse subunit B
VPAFFELAFGLPQRRAGGDSLPALVFGEGDDALHVGGRIDRVDQLPDGAGVVVVDYKLGAQSRERAKLRADVVAKTQLQLPLYARAAQRGLGVPRVDAAFVSLKDAAPTKTLVDVHGDEADALLGEALDARVRELGDGLRAGSFEIRPVDKACTRCAYRTVCRVVKLAESEEEDAA